MLSLADFDLDSLGAQLLAWGRKPSQARRLLRAFYGGNPLSALDDRNLGKGLQAKLRETLAPLQTEVVHRHLSSDGTVKLLVEMADAQRVEAVYIPAFRDGRAAGCISSQVGCAMGCDFCASARGGLARNLSGGEIVEQFIHLQAQATEDGRRISSLVFMGMGEPLHNLPNVLAAIERIAHPSMGNLGWRHITVSTVGIVPAMQALAGVPQPVYLAVSLHAPDDATRSRIVPLNRKWNVQAVMEAAREFQQRTGRVTTIEYCLLAGVNDSDEQARLLGRLMHGFHAHVNLIPHNWIGAGISGVEYRKPDPARIERFASLLRELGVVVHQRVARGDDVAGACGQLRHHAGSRSRPLAIVEERCPN